MAAATVVCGCPNEDAPPSQASATEETRYVAGSPSHLASPERPEASLPSTGLYWEGRGEEA